MSRLPQRFGRASCHEEFQKPLHASRMVAAVVGRLTGFCTWICHPGRIARYRIQVPVSRKAGLGAASARAKHTTSA
jgi:hypothetical protein